MTANAERLSRGTSDTTSLTAKPAASENPIIKCGRYTGTLLLTNPAKMTAAPTERINSRSGPAGSAAASAVTRGRHDRQTSAATPATIAARNVHKSGFGTLLVTRPKYHPR
jgi:hypothetical protein